jgi:hypothetical protein
MATVTATARGQEQATRTTAAYRHPARRKFSVKTLDVAVLCKLARLRVDEVDPAFQIPRQEVPTRQLGSVVAANVLRQTALAPCVWDRRGTSAMCASCADRQRGLRLHPAKVAACAPYRSWRCEPSFCLSGPSCPPSCDAPAVPQERQHPPTHGPHEVQINCGAEWMLDSWVRIAELVASGQNAVIQ